MRAPGEPVARNDLRLSVFARGARAPSLRAREAVRGTGLASRIETRRYNRKGQEVGTMFPRKLKRILVATLPPAALLAMALVGGCCDDECPVILDRTPPAPPQGAYPVTGDRTVTLFWWPNTEPDLAGYNVYWRYEGERNFRFLASTRDYYYIDRGLTNGTTYEYVVTAFDIAGNESADSALMFDTPRPEGFNLKLYNYEKRNLGGNYLLNAYDFSAFRRTDWATDEEADIFYSYADGLYLMEGADEMTDIQDAGYIAIEDVDWAPDGGWSGTGTAELIMGHSYVVWTRTNNFAKFQVVDLAPDYVTIDWAYQEVTGLPELLRPGGAAADSGAARGG